MRDVAQDLISSYDARVDAIGTIIDNTYEILEGFRDKRAKLSRELKETLAKKESLRKKDFDRMINGILLSQAEKEKEVKQNLKNFIKEQKKQASELRDALTNGEVERIKKAQIEIEKGIVKIKGLLKYFGEEQEGLTSELRKLLNKGKDLKIKDFKETTRNLSQDVKFGQTLNREKEVKRMGLQDVATDIKSLGQDMAASYVDRKRMIEALQKETKLRVKEVSDLLSGFQEEHSERKSEVAQMLDAFVEDLHSEIAQLRKEVRKLMGGIQKESEQRKDEVGEVEAAVKEMHSSVAKVKSGARKVSAHSLAETGEKKPARRAKGK
jgi:DNA-binding transcriptional MerR regulator